MTQTSYSFLDVAALDGVRERFAAGEALAILSAALDEVIWANGPGAALLGHASVETIFGADAPLRAPARRQIASLRGFPEIGRDRPLLVRVTRGMSSEALRFVASAVTMPDGERAILLAQPAADGMQAAALGQAIGGFSEPGHVLAFIDANGAAVAASAGFERLGLGADALAGLAREATADGHIARRRLAATRGLLPVGLVRLTAERFLLVAVDENWAQADEPVAEPVEPSREREVWNLASEGFAPVAEEAAAETPAVAIDDAPVAVVEADESEAGLAIVEETVSVEQPVVQAEPEPAVAEPVTEATPHVAADSIQAVEAEDELAEVDAGDNAGDQPATGHAPTQLPSAPVRFVWRTDADGKFSQVSKEFATAVGPEAADVLERRFQDVANAFALDPSGDIAGLLSRRDTWSGRTVHWPIAGTDLRVPVDLAALPVYDRNRKFEGFRGFGVARMGDAAIDPEGIGLALRSVPRPAAATPVEPVRDEKAVEAPATETVERPSEKIIQLAERRAPAPEKPAEPTGNVKVLSLGERLAFQQIGERLRRASDKAAIEKAAAEMTKDAAAEPELPMEQPAAEAPAVVGAAESAGPEVEARTVAEHIIRNDGVELSSPESDPVTPEVPTIEAEESVGPATAPVRRTRTGMSLLGSAQWEEASAQVEQGANSAIDDVDPPPAFQATSPARGEESASLAAAETETPASDLDTSISETADSNDAVFAETDLEPVEPAVEDEIEAEDDAVEATSALDGKLAHPALRAASPARGEESAQGDGLSILEKLPVAVLVHSGDVLHYGNDEFFALTGYASIEALAQAGGIGALFADDETGDMQSDHRDDGSLQLTTAGGGKLPVEVFLQSVPWGAGKALILVLSKTRDGFGGQSPLIAELEARVAEMRTIIDTATDGVVLISPEGKIRSISRPAEALFGMDSDDAAGKPFGSLFAMESQKAARDYLAGLSEHGVASVLNDGREVIGREAEGRFIPLFMTIGKLPGDSGYCAVVRDITQWKRAEEELTQARSTAERASYHKSEFLARVSHEIRTPLNAIIGFSELMMDEKFGPVANDRYRDYLRDINRSGNHVLDLVNDLLDISKIEAGQQEMSYEAVQLNETLSETVALMQPQANRERVIIRSSFASRLPDVVADLRSVRQIALNILSNAVRYTQAGGQVIVSTAYEAGGDVVLRVRDTGIGMTPAEIEQALKPFKQINSLKRPRGDGTGLGLPLTKAMVEANRARFTINSTPGEGTLVEVAFPSTRVLAD